MNRKQQQRATGVAAAILIIALAGSGAAVFGRQTTQPTQPPAAAPPQKPNPRDEEVRSKIAQAIALAIGRAHGNAIWRSRQGVQAEIRVEEAGKTVLDGVMTYDIRGKRSRLELKDGTTVVFDGERAWVSPASAAFADARFHVQRWPFLFAAAYRMQDRGMVYSHYEERSFRGKMYDSFMLSYPPGAGDWPDDWFMCFAESKDHELRAMAYISTYGGRAREQAERDIRAIVYDSYNTVEGSILPVRCSFWQWSAARGIHGEQLGSAHFSNIRYVELNPELFAKQPEAREDAPKRAAATQNADQ